MCTHWITIPDCVEKDIDEIFERFRGHIALGVQDLVVAPLHDVLLQVERVTDVDALQLLLSEPLQLCVELSHPILRQEAQKVQAQQLTPA